MRRPVAEPVVWALGSVAVVSLLSLVGAFSLTFGALRRHGVMMFLVALAAGTLIGDAFLHLLPEASHIHGGFGTDIALTVIGGFLLMFVLEVVLRWKHAHGEHAHDEPVHGPHHGHEDTVQPFGWLNLTGDAVHNFVDGIVIATAYLIDIRVGLATTIAVALHEIPQELGDFAVLVRAGLSHGKALLLNLASALVAVVGAALVFVMPIPAETLEGIALPAIAGAFLYIAAADLIPELHHHTRRKEVGLILLAFLVGILLMYGLLGFESLGSDAGHAHD